MKSAIILLAIVLVVRAEPDPSVAKEEALNQLLEQLSSKGKGVETGKLNSMVEEIRKVRATSTVLGWVDPTLNGCQALSGKIATYCGSTYRTPGTIIRRIVPLLEPFVETINAGLSASCQNTVKQVLCNGFFPRCSSDATTATYQSLTTACSSIGTCQSAININGQNTAALCLDSGKTINLKTCQKYSASTINQVQCGNLPANITFPSLSISGLAREGILAGNLPLVLTVGGTSASCQNQWVQFLCTLTPYCSADGSTILTAVTKQQCESAINCLPTVLKQTFGKSYACSTYPDQNTLRMCVNPSQGFKTASTNLVCNKASAISIGSTLFYLACVLLAYFH